MNLFLASAAAQHVVKSACLFKKPHVNLGTQQYTLHFKKPLWVDFYFHSFKMGIKKPRNSQNWTEWEEWGTGALWWQKEWSPCEPPWVCDFTPFQVWHKLVLTTQLPSFPTASVLGAITTVPRHSSNFILMLSQEESVSSIHPFKANPKYFQPILWACWIFPCGYISPLYFCACSNKNKAIIYLPWLLYRNWIFIPVSYLPHSEPTCLIILQQTWSEMTDSLIYFSFY